MPRLIALAAALFLASVVTAQDMRSLTGNATYLDRMALPPDATLMLEVTGPDGAILAEARIPTDGRQVPIPFALDLPAGTEGTLRAGLTMGAQIGWLGAPIAIAGDTEDLGELVLQRFQPMGFVSAFRCGEHVIRVGFAGDSAVMDTGTERLVLQPVRAASGARYEAESDPDTWFWNQGDSALVSLAGTQLPECTMSLPMGDTPSRAGGNEPFWSITVDGGEMLLVRLDMDDLTLPVTESTLTDTGVIVVTAADPDRGLRAVLERLPELCRDTMSGMPHPETVRLSMGDHTIHGCGGDPWSLLTGRTWVVEDIGDAGIIDSSRATLGFDASGRAYGSASCNRFNGAVELTGEGLRFGPMATTMMACPDAIMAQERRMLDALAEVYAFDIDDTGALLLFGPSGPVITARAATDGSDP
jgi:heat shock protein HslJ